MDTSLTPDKEDLLSILESMSDAFCAVDEQWRLIYINGRAEQITHVNGPDLLGKLIWDAFPETIGSAFYDHYHLKSAEGIRLRVEVFCPQAEAWLEVNAMPSPLGLAFYFRDVTKERKSSADLAQLAEQMFSQHAYLETLLRHVPVGVVISEAPSGRVLYGNERMEEILGHPIVPPKNVTEYAVWRGYHPNGRPYEPHEWPLARAVTSGEVVCGEEIHIERPDGVRLALLVSAAPIRDRLGKILAGIVVDQDITDRKQTLDSMENCVRLEKLARREAEQANRFKDQFIAMVSHELRTPLTPVALSLAALELDSHLPENLHDEVAMLRRNVEIETQLIDDLLDITSISNGKFRLDIQRTGIHALLRQVQEIVEGDVHLKSQKVTLDLKAQHDTVGGDPVRLHQVFWNIVKNAIKFTPRGGEITIQTSNPSVSTIEIEVKDGGVGIAAEDLSRIFGVFEQGDQGVHRQFGGLGIGLTICKTIIDLHGGGIRAHSDGRGKGSVFLVELPTAPAIEGRAVVKPDRTKLADSIHVLLVEDHEDTLRVMRRLLEMLGYKLATARSSSAALNFAATNDFDVLVSDIGLPDVSGHELVRQVKKIRDVPAVAISGFGSKSDIEKSLQAGFCAHLTKPLNFDLLHKTLQNVVSKVNSNAARLVIPAQ
ncbi:MAG: ATP-binding protein [Tepidisphaeraceae bacterium]|jgi:PAS domain S-box-containing protein